MTRRFYKLLGEVKVGYRCGWEWLIGKREDDKLANPRRAALVGSRQLLGGGSGGGWRQ